MCHTSGVSAFVLLVDDVAGRFDPAREGFTVLPYEVLEVPDPQFVRFAYPAHGVCCTAKPYLLKYLVAHGYDEVLYLDSDLFIVGDLAPLFDRLTKHPVLLTPHLTDPAPTGPCVEEQPLNVGSFNAGFLGVRAGPTADRFLSWWADRVYPRPKEYDWEAVSYDQRWLDLAPGLIDGLQVLRDDGCNIGYWNLPTRGVTLEAVPASAPRVRVNGHPGYFFHFSAFDPHDHELLSRNAPNLRLKQLGAASQVVEEYRGRLLAAGYDACRDWVYTRDRFDNGARIALATRRLYRQLGAAAREFDDPFQTAGPTSFFRWLNERDPADGQSPTDETSHAASSAHPSISRFWHAVFRQRPDLQCAFPHVFGVNREAYLSWAYRVGEPYGELRPAPPAATQGPATREPATRQPDVEPPAEAPLLPESELSLESMRAAVETRTAWAESLLADATQRGQVIADQREELERLRTECARRASVIAEQQAVLEALRSAVAERTEWAERLLVDAERRGAIIAEQHAALEALQRAYARRQRSAPSD